MRCSHLDGIIAVLDRLEIEIAKPLSNEIEDPAKYYNWKGLFALVLKAAVSEDYTYIFSVRSMLVVGMM